MTEIKCVHGLFIKQPKVYVNSARVSLALLSRKKGLLFFLQMSVSLIFVYHVQFLINQKHQNPLKKHFILCADSENK